jgi:hypothetical protein
MSLIAINGVVTTTDLSVTTFADASYVDLAFVTFVTMSV